MTNPLSWSRRFAVRTFAALAAAAWWPIRRVVAACRSTLPTEDGPFYPEGEIPLAIDLTRRAPDGPRAAGKRLYLMGRVTDAACRPVGGAVVEIWQCDTKGRYDHSRSGANGDLDPGFRYFAKTETDPSGRYRFLTIRPSRYKVFGLERAPHIHMKVRHRSLGTLTTEVYFRNDEDDRLRLIDRVFQSRGDRKGELIVPVIAASDVPELGQETEPRAEACRFEVAFE